MGGIGGGDGAVEAQKLPRKSDPEPLAKGLFLFRCQHQGTSQEKKKMMFQTIINVGGSSKVNHFFHLSVQLCDHCILHFRFCYHYLWVLCAVWRDVSELPEKWIRSLIHNAPVEYSFSLFWRLFFGSTYLLLNAQRFRCSIKSGIVSDVWLSKNENSEMKK